MTNQNPPSITGNGEANVWREVLCACLRSGYNLDAAIMGADNAVRSFNFRLQPADKIAEHMEAARKITSTSNN